MNTMSSTETIAPPLARLESQPEDLMGSAGIDEITNTSRVHDNEPNGAMNPVLSDSTSQPTFITGTETSTPLPPLHSEVKKDNKAVPW